MQSSPNREKLFRFGHCQQCSVYCVRSQGGKKIVCFRTEGQRVQHRPKHGLSKPKGIHVKRRHVRKERTWLYLAMIFGA